jgi:hypothetical protein
MVIMCTVLIIGQRTVVTAIDTLLYAAQPPVKSQNAGIAMTLQRNSRTRLSTMARFSISSGIVDFLMSFQITAHVKQLPTIPTIMMIHWNTQANTKLYSLHLAISGTFMKTLSSGSVELVFLVKFNIVVLRANTVHD